MKWPLEMQKQRATTAGSADVMAEAATGVAVEADSAAVGAAAVTGSCFACSPVLFDLRRTIPQSSITQVFPFGVERGRKRHIR